MASDRTEHLALHSEFVTHPRRPGALKLRGWRQAVLVAGYLAGYLVLDWASVIHPFLGYTNITPWNPPPGLTLTLLLIFGIGYAPLLFVAGIVSDIVLRGFPAPLHVSLMANLAMAVCYTGIAWLMLRLRFNPVIESVRDMALLAAAALVGSAVVATLVIGVYVGFGALPWERFGEGTLRYWVGDAIGIAVTAPLFLRVQRLERPPVGVPEMILQTAALAACLWFLADVSLTDKFKFFYILFVPAIWIAVRHGLTAAALVCFLSQFLLMADALHDKVGATEIIELQALMMTLAVTVLFTGVLVDERREQEAAREKLRDEVSHLARLSTGGEIATGLAHELNQPLTALLNYVRVSKAQLERGSPTPQVLEPLLKAEAQGVRAAKTVQSLHDFLRYGEFSLDEFDLGEAVGDAVALVRVAQRPLDLPVRVGPEIAGLSVTADRVQTTQILVNLVTNAFEAIAERRVADGAIDISARREDGEARIAVADNGPGVPAEDRGRIFDSFFTTKAEGMGLGLAICRTLAEAQGGHIWYEDEGVGGHRFVFTLRLAEG